MLEYTHCSRHHWIEERISAKNGRLRLIIFACIPLYSEGGIYLDTDVFELF
jgi:hypothetical protein